MNSFALIQNATYDNQIDALNQTAEWVFQAAQKKAKCVVFPEEFITLGYSPEQKREMAEPFLKGPCQQKISEMAKKNKIWIVAGTLPLQSDTPHQYYSSTTMWNDKGECVARYDKIHLFDVEVGPNEHYRESDFVKAGKALVTLATPFGKCGMAICYDLRFPELFRYFMLKKVDIILLPSAFTTPTGQAHWHTLLKARAVENLCYIVAPNHVGKRLSGHFAYGHSMIIDPWGETVAQMGDQPGMMVTEVDLSKCALIRKKFPSTQHYQPFIFERLAKEMQGER